MVDLVKIGRVVKTRGVNGEVLVKFENGKCPKSNKEPLFLDFEEIKVPFFISSLRDPLPNEWYIIFEDYFDKTQAEKLVFCNVFVSGDNLYIEKDNFPVDLLTGFNVYDVEFGFVGSVAYFHKGLQEIMIVENDGKEILIPFVDEFISEIDYDKKQITVNTPEGLINLND